MTDSKAVLGAATRTLVLCPVLRSAGSAVRTPEARLAEAIGLAQAIDLDVVHGEVVKLDRPRPATLLEIGRAHV